MENIFQEVKERARIETVCDLLGIKLNRNHMCLCPFHSESTPSFSVSVRDNIFNCFGCGKKGDVITLVCEMLKVQPLEAVIFLNNNLGLGLEVSSKRGDGFYRQKQYKKKTTTENSLKEWQQKMFQKLTNRYRELRNYEKTKSIELINEPDLYFEDSKVVYFLKNKEFFEDLIQQFTELDTNDANEILLLKKQMQKVGGLDK